MSILISIEKLLSGNFVEGTRMEFKEGWNPKTIMRSICAFANDFENEGSGYIIVGVAEENGIAIRPVKGFDVNQFEKVQKDLIGYCNLISPSYVPRLSLEDIDDKKVLVIWVPAGTLRPYKVPDDILAKNKVNNFRIRQFSSSVIPNAEQEMELVQLTAKVPYDDRVNSYFTINDLDFGLMREHLSKTGSKLFQESTTMMVDQLAEKMNLCQGTNEHLFPKNVGLLMFSKNTSELIHGAQIDVVEFPEGIGAKEFKENIFKGTIQKQLMDVLSYLKSQVVKSKVIKYSDRAESDTVFNYPYEALEEALSNAVYHKNYELREPIEVRVLPTAIEIISYNGVDPSLKQSDFDEGTIRNRRYRNRRIGEFLKELNLTEGRGTGIPTMKRVLNRNGSPKPLFDTNEPERSCFITELTIHPEFIEVKNDGGQVNDNVRGEIRNDFGMISERIRNDFGKEVADTFDIICANPDFTAKEISELINKSPRTVENYTARLKEAGIIQRKGAKLGGSWEVIL
jgi:ATP-dependent DNA helicase RecG